MLQAERQAVEMGPFSNHIHINPEAPFSNPFQYQTEVPRPDTAVRGHRATHHHQQQAVGEVDQRRLLDTIESSTSENVDLMTTVIEFVTQFVAANGPISLFSPKFLDFINGIPIELQVLISGLENGIYSLLDWCEIMFIEDIAFTKEQLEIPFLSNSGSITTCLDLARPLIRLRAENDSTPVKVNHRRSRRNSAPGVLLFRQEVQPADEEQERHNFDDDDISNRSDENDYEYHQGFDSEDIANCEEEVSSENGSSQADDDAEAGANERSEEKIRLLNEKLQSCEDKLFAAQKQTNLERKLKLDEMENSAALAQKLKDAEINFSHLSTKLEREMKLLKNRLAVQLEETRSIDEERRKSSDLQREMTALQKNFATVELNHDTVVKENGDLHSQVTALQSNLAAMELNHHSLMTENRELKDRVSSLQSELAQKEKRMDEMATQVEAMAVKVKDMAVKMTNHVCDKTPVETESPKRTTSLGSTEPPLINRLPLPAPPMHRFHMPCPPPLIGGLFNPMQGYNLLRYPGQFNHLPYQMQYPMPPYNQPSFHHPTSTNSRFGTAAHTAAGAPSESATTTPCTTPPLTRAVSNVDLFSMQSTSIATSNGLDMPEPNSPVRQAKSVKSSKGKPAQERIDHVETNSTAEACGGVKVIEERINKKAERARGISSSPSQSPNRPLSSTFDNISDNVSEGGQSGDSNAGDFSLPYSVKSEQAVAGAAISARLRLRANQSVCQSERIYTYLCNEFPTLTKIQFLTCFEMVRSRRKQNTLTGLRLKDIVELIRPEVHRQISYQAKSTPVFYFPPTAGPSFWSDGPGKPDTSKKAIVGDDVCAICLDEIKEDDAHFMQCPGRHCYHPKCIRRWYSNGNTSCPKCGVHVPLHEHFPKLKN